MKPHTETPTRIHDWNIRDQSLLARPVHPVEVMDETLRDGIQSPSALDPPVEEKLEILRLMDALGVDVADIGLPAASTRNFDDVVRMARFIRDEGLKLRAACAARTVVTDVERIVEASQRAGVPITVYAFIGSSPIRFYAEGWNLDHLVATTRAAVRAGTRGGLEVSFVTEDTTRAHPDDLEVLFRAALDEGARRLCLCDTVGHATPDGARALVAWVSDLLSRDGFSEVGIDWHGHNDRGLALANALAAASAGAHRIHGTVLGIGERVGNVATDQLLLNLWLLGWTDRSIEALMAFCQRGAEALGSGIPINYPAVGQDAFRTATGVHAAAILKASQKGDPDLSDRVYSGVPAWAVGRHQEIELGPMSGKSNAIFWLKARDIEPTPARIAALLAAAKRSDRTLTEAECRAALEA